MRGLLTQQGASVELDCQGKDMTEQRCSNRVDWTKKKLVGGAERKMRANLNKTEKNS